MKRMITCCLIMGYLHWSVTAQRIDQTAAVHHTENEHYLRFHYNNDFFTKTDYYYTQGYELELAAPYLHKNPLTKTLLLPKEWHRTYGLAFEHYGFTPTSITSDQILKGDRPFAGVILLKSFGTSIDIEKKQRISATLSTGMIGPAAFAGRMQATIHQWTGDAVPHGWQYQIGNDVVINYEMNHEKEIFNFPNIASMHTHTRLSLGTLSDKAQTGITLTLGRFGSPFVAYQSAPAGVRFRLYAYMQPSIAVIGYDATLQGGLFNRHDPYVLRATEINRVVFQNNAGIVAHIWKIQIEYSRSFLSREFKIGRQHRWGGLNIGYAF